ncbi:S8 family serine peptidase [Actinoplanes bogorensis]|uniref:S8 family serine peptidase n=1 Tax=Paractinoplanes bogorensis TaxID=1610840 RepID=A0ABS5YHF1_9ACTN|nr:S8 family serine peptidase [Actinoplanes bogorensis]
MSLGSGITVAVIDSGTYPHPDIQKNLLSGISLVSGESGKGQNDRVGHGTEMAALIAAHGRGSRGVLGISPAAKILPVKITNTTAAPASEMAKGIDWAVSEKADVINISAAIGPSFEVQDAVRKAIAADVLVVASVGNRSSSAVVGYPAAMDGVLAVGANGRNGKYSPSSFRTPKVQICAPGVDITTAEPENRYADVGGTSPATAIAAGAAALVRAKFPNLTTKEVINRLTSTADDIGPAGRDDECGFGRLNIVKALTANVPPLEGGAASGPSASDGPPVGDGVSSAPVARRPEFASPAPTAAASEPAGNSSVLLFGGLAGVVAAGAVVLALLLRRRGRGAR